MGQAAGLAAAQCAKSNLRPRDLQGAKLRDELKKQGAIL
jgi:hypothetical protein